MIKIKALLITLAIILGLFILGFFGINLGMKIMVGHGKIVEVPELKGMDINVAINKCNGLKLYVEQIDNVYSDDFEKGQIISQDPHANINTKNFRTIKVVVSEGPEMVRIPFLYNLAITESRLKLENVGLQLGKKQYRYSDIVEVDKVIYSEPNADALIAKKSEVDIVVSLGKLASSTTENNKWLNLLDDEE